MQESEIQEEKVMEEIDISAFNNELSELKALLVEKERQIDLLNETLASYESCTIGADQLNFASSGARKGAIFFLRHAFVVLRTFGAKKFPSKMREFIEIYKSDLFDDLFYMKQLRTRKKSRAELVLHYIKQAGLGLDPSPRFSRTRYQLAYPDVAESGVEPLYHYLRFGRNERRASAVSELCFEERGGDAIVRYFDKVPTKERERRALSLSEIEGRPMFEWHLRDEEGVTMEGLGLYDHRPDDPVLSEIRAGAMFLDSDGSSEAFKLKLASVIDKSTTFLSPDDQEIPKVSIVVPVYNQISYTLNCLDSLFSQISKHCFEIIVADDCSQDETHEALLNIRNIHYFRSEQNCGFIRNCNYAASQARGQILVFLNNDTRVCEGWLDWLVDSFSLFPKAGLVGSKILYPDATLQEAGGIVWDDGSAWNYGRNDDPNRPRYCFAREVDYISGCSIAIPTSLWKQVGGFSEEFIPAYCEDVDIAFKIQNLGFETWYQPLSKLIHYEGKSSGTDVSSGIKSYQPVNTKKLHNKWANKLSSHGRNGAQPWNERERKVTKRVLVIDACNPTPWQDAGSLATVNLCKAYQSLGYQVMFLPQSNYLFQRRAVEALQSIGIHCLYAPFETAIDGVLAKYGRLLDVVSIVRMDVANDVLDAVKRLAPKAKIVFLNADLHFLRIERQAHSASDEKLLRVSERVREQELDIINRSDVTLTHSTFEQDLLAKLAPHASTVVLPLVESTTKVSSNWQRRNAVMFLGGYNHPPNMDAAIWLIDRIWPLVVERQPAAKLLIVGSNPPEELANRESDSVIVTGSVAELGPWFASSKVFVAPLRFGAGAKGKLVAAAAHGIPIVATPVATEGMNFVNEEDVFLGSDEAELADKVLAVLNADEPMWSEWSESVRAKALSHHSFESSVSALNDALQVAYHGGRMQ